MLGEHINAQDAENGRGERRGLGSCCEWVPCGGKRKPVFRCAQDDNLVELKICSAVRDLKRVVEADF